MSHELLPDDLLWAEGGHASDIALTAIADDQRSIVPKATLDHVHGCQQCTKHLGHSALLSLHVGAALKAQEEHALKTASRPIPWVAIALGLLVASLGMLQSLFDHDGALSGLANLASLARAGRKVVRHLPSEAFLIASYGGSLLLVAMALAATQLLTKKEVHQ